MKKLLSLLLLLPSIGFCDTKISALGSTTTLNAFDIIPVVTNPGTSPANKSVTFQNFTAPLTAGLLAVGVDTASLKTGQVAVGIDTASLKVITVNIGVSTQAAAQYFPVSLSTGVTGTLPGIISNQNTLQSGSTFYVSSGTVNGQFNVTGANNAQIQGTLAAASGLVASTYTVVWTSGSYTVGNCAVFTSTNGTVAGNTCGTGGGAGTPGGSTQQLQYNNAGSFGGVSNTVVTSTVIITSTHSILNNTTTTGNTNAGLLDVYSNAPHPVNLMTVGSSSNQNILIVPNNNWVDMSALGSKSGSLITGDTVGGSGLWANRIYSGGDTNAFIDFRTLGTSTGTWQTTTGSGPGDIRLVPGGTLEETLSTVSGATFQSSMTVYGAGGIGLNNALTFGQGSVPGHNIYTTTYNDAGATGVSSGWDNANSIGYFWKGYNSQYLMTLTNPGGILSLSYGVIASSYSGGGLTTCGDATHALGWSSTNNLFTCQNVTGSGGGGGSYMVAVGTGGVGGYTGTITSSSTVSQIILFDSATYTTKSLGGGTTVFVTPNYSSMTAQGVITAASLGALTGNQSITVSGDSSGSGTTAITLTAAGRQANITTLAASSTTVTGNAEIDGWTTHLGSETIKGATGLGVTYNINAGSTTGSGLTTCSGAGNAVNWNSSTNLFGCASGYLTGNQSITLSGDSTGSGTTAITATAAARQANITTLAASSTTVTGNAEVDGWTTFVGSASVKGGTGLGVTYAVNAGSMTGAGLGSCSGAGNALTWASATNLFGCASGYLTANQSITLSGDASGSGATAITVTDAARQANITTLAASSVTTTGNMEVDGWATHIGSMTINGATGLGVKYNVNAGSMTGAGLGNCGDASHALSWNSSTNLFGCQSVTGSAATPGGITGNVQYANGTAFAGATNFNVNPSSVVVGTALQTFTQGGITISSGINIDASNVITGTTTITSTMSVVLASCTTRGASPQPWMTLYLPPSKNGEMHTIYDVGGDSCSIRIQANGADLIESTGTLQLDAQTQHASLHGLGSNLWGSGEGGIQYTPWAAFTTQDDVGTFSVGVSSQVTMCPVQIREPVTLMGFRTSRPTASGTNRAVFAIYDKNRKFVVETATVTLVNAPATYLTGAATQLAPGYYYAAFTAVNTLVAISGSNTITDQKIFCGNAGTSTTGMDLSTFVPSNPLTGAGTTYPAFDLIFNGGLQGF